MPRILYEIAFTKIGDDDYLMAPKKGDAVLIGRCNGITADIISNMYPERCSQEANAELISAKYGITYDEALAEVNAVIGYLRSVQPNTQNKTEGSENSEYDGNEATN